MRIHVKVSIVILHGSLSSVRKRLYKVKNYQLSLWNHDSRFCFRFVSFCFCLFFVFFYCFVLFLIYSLFNLGRSFSVQYYFPIMPTMECTNSQALPWSELTAWGLCHPLHLPQVRCSWKHFWALPGIEPGSICTRVKDLTTAPRCSSVWRILYHNDYMLLLQGELDMEGIKGSCHDVPLPVMGYCWPSGYLRRFCMTTLHESLEI